MAQIEFPKVLSVEQLSEKGAFNLKHNEQLVQQILRESLNGVITKDGKWAVDTQGKLLSPDTTWGIEHKEIGKYKIIHRIGYKNTSLSVSTLDGHGSINVLEHHPEWFIIETIVNKVHTDMSFMFSLIKVISPSVSPLPPL
jgi:hypothetical protein